MSNKTIETLFQILAAVLLGVAAYFLWQGNYEGVFVSSVLSSVSYFLSYRYQVRERLDRRDAEREQRELDEMHMNRALLQEGRGLFEIETEEADNRTEKTPSEKR
jgi:membrane protein implicated in regulation of membrane protease activity